jgi:hypothetical protein
MSTPSNKPYVLKSESLEPKYATLSIEELRQLQQYKEDHESKMELEPELSWMSKDKEALQKVLVATLTDAIHHRTKAGRPKKRT